MFSTILINKKKVGCITLSFNLLSKHSISNILENSPVLGENFIRKANQETLHKITFEEGEYFIHLAKADLLCNKERFTIPEEDSETVTLYLFKPEIYDYHQILLLSNVRFRIYTSEMIGNFIDKRY